MAAPSEADAVRARVSASTMKRLAAVEARRDAVRHVGNWPAIMSVDDWEAIAQPMLARLCSDTRDPVVIAEERPDPSDVTYRHTRSRN